MNIKLCTIIICLCFSLSFYSAQKTPHELFAMEVDSIVNQSRLIRQITTKEGNTLQVFSSGIMIHESADKQTKIINYKNGLKISMWLNQGQEIEYPSGHKVFGDKDGNVLSITDPNNNFLDKLPKPEIIMSNKSR